MSDALTAANKENRVPEAKVTAERKPRLFYYEEAVDSWIPAPDKVENIIIASEQMDDQEEIEIRFKRFDLTDEEYDNLPEV